ncbi:MAG TPA: hypothetical protein VGD83_35705, partial [Streptosporangiaceae bacterium]
RHRVFPADRHRMVREIPVIDLMQDAFYSRAKADEPRRCTGCRHAAEAMEAAEATEATKAAA